MLRIGKRLKSVAEEIGEVNTFADIGTDHGQLIIYALEHGYAKRAFAVDISEKSLSKAVSAIAEAGLSEKVDFFVGDGLTTLKEIPDVAVIAGMGGNEIVHILSSVSMDTKYVLVPHSDAHVLREYLCSHGYKIEKDYVVFDGKYYAVITCKYGKTEYDRSKIVLGGDNPHTKEFEERILDRKKRIEKILSEKNMSSDSLQPELREEYEEINEWLRSKTH